MRLGDTPAGHLEIIAPLLDADEVAAELGAGDAGRAAAHEGIEDGFAGVGELQYPIGNERQRFLRGVLATLDIADPDGMMAAAVPALLALAVQNGDGFAWMLISAELRASA